MRWINSIQARIYALVALIAITAAGIAAVSITQMVKIGSELTEIAHEDIPLTEIVTAVTIHQLEQAILFEQAMRGGVPGGASLGEIKTKFDKLAHTADEEIKIGEEIAKQALSHDLSEEAKAEFQHVLDSLIRIEKEHKTYSSHADEVMDLIRAGQISEANGLAIKVEHEQAELDHELKELQHSIAEFTAQSAEHALETEQFTVLLIAIIAAGAIVLGASAGILIGRSISIPIVKATNAQAELADGNLNVEVPVYQSPVEIARLCSAMSKLQKVSQDAERMRSEEANLRETARREQRRGVLELADKFENAVGGIITGLSSSVTELSATSSEVNDIAHRTAQRSATVRDSANDAGQDVRAVTTSVDEVNKAVEEVAGKVTETSQLTSTAAVQAGDAAQKVAALNAASAKISDIVSLIASIAEQTNLLALNATIEAARAGDAGKGFAVVAGEVKTLASQTQKATEEIGQQVAEMLTEIEASTAAVKIITDAVTATDATMTSIAGAVEEQSVTTGEVARAARAAFERIEAVVKEITAMAEDAEATGAATEMVRQTADELSRSSNTLTMETEGFIHHIRTDDEDGSTAAA